MHSHPGCSLFIAAAVIGLISVVSIYDWQPEAQSASHDSGIVVDQDSMLEFATTIDSSVHTTSYSVDSENPFRLPSAEIALRATDPVITASSQMVAQKKPLPVRSHPVSQVLNRNPPTFELEPSERFVEFDKERVNDESREEEPADLEPGFPCEWDEAELTTQYDPPAESEIATDAMWNNVPDDEYLDLGAVAPLTQADEFEPVLLSSGGDESANPFSLDEGISLAPTEIEFPEEFRPNRRSDLSMHDTRPFRTAHDASSEQPISTPVVEGNRIPIDLGVENDLNNREITEERETLITKVSEVVVRPRGPSQPIRELKILEWRPKAVWPKPIAIVEELERLEQVAVTQVWASETLSLFKRLNRADSFQQSGSELIFRQLAVQLQRLDEIAMSVSTVPVQWPEYVQGEFATELKTFHYDIARHLTIWMHVAQLASQNEKRFVDIENQTVQNMILASRKKLALPGVGSNWSDYLSLDPLASAFDSLNPDPEQQRTASRETLSRYFSPVLNAEQREFLQSHFDDELINYLRIKATDEVNLTEFMTILEQHEAHGSGYTAHKVNDAYQSLLWSTDPLSQQLGAQVEAHYRNANFRVSVSDRLINRLIPQQPDMDQPIYENLMGAEIQGNSRVQNRLLIRLIPDNLKVNMRLEADGRVRSLTQARRSGFVVDNVGNSRFRVFKQLAFHRNGIESAAPYATSETNSRVIGMRSNLDPIPIVGWVARRIAQNKIAESTPATDQYTRQKLESLAKEQVDTEVESQLNRVREYMFANILQPLIALELEPTPIEMRTTEDRIIMRYRLAGRDQLASHTARPRALANSLLSVQFHQSVFNNLLDRIEIKGRTFTADELTEHLKDVFRSDQVTGSKEMEHDATFVFAPYDPLRVEFNEGKIQISLNLRKLQIGKGKSWKNISVGATFHPRVEGAKLVLEQADSGISLKDSKLKFRDQVAVRAVFTALFQDRYEMNVLPAKFGEQFRSPDLTITQLALNDGWICISLGDINQTAARPTPPAARAMGR